MVEFVSKIYKKRDSFRNGFFSVLFVFTVVFVFFTIFLFTIPFPEENFNKKESTVVYDKNGELLRVFRSNKGQFCFPFNSESPLPDKLVKTVLYYEDRYFFYHQGINPFSIFRALAQNIISRRRVSGASTITMQLSRLMREKPRTLPNKVLEMLQSIRFELKYNKEKLLRMYLTYCPYGGNVFGYRTAVKRYFRTEPDSLTWAQAALLAVLPNSPQLMHPEKNRHMLIEKRDRLLERMFDDEILSEEEYSDAVDEKVPNVSYPFETSAWHVARFLNQRVSRHEIKTTLNKQYQVKTEQLLRNFSERFPETSLTNIAALVVDNSTSEIKVWLGSPDFFDTYTNGQVDGVMARRDAGKMLHPFLYASAIDRGILMPESIIPDIEEVYDGYVPANRDGQYLGLVEASKVMENFRVAPAVKILSEIGFERFYTFLRHAGMETLEQPPEWYRFSLVSGGVDIRLIDLASLFKGLANYGKFSKPEILFESSGVEGRQLISSAASWLVISNMSKSDDGKTRTASDCTRSRKDCWFVRISPQWTVLFWGGSIHGKSAQDYDMNILRILSREIYRMLEKKSEKEKFMKPVSKMKKISLCSETGYASGEYCEKTMLRYAPQNMEKLKVCPWHNPDGLKLPAEIK